MFLFGIILELSPTRYLELSKFFLSSALALRVLMLDDQTLSISTFTLKYAL